MKNDSAQAEAGGFLAAEFRSELAGRGQLEGEASSAPELQVELFALSSLPTAAGAEGAAAFRLVAQVRVRAGDYVDVVGGSEDYLAGIDVLGTEANRRAALRRLARSIAKEAVERYDVADRLR